MRKWILLLLIAVLAVQLLPAGANAAAAEGALTAKIDQSDRTVVIEGRLPEAGTEVLVTVTDPEGRMDYFNQKKTDEAGGFRFSYVSLTATKGTYRVRAIGSSAGGGAPLEAEYTYSGTTPTSGGDSGANVVPGTDDFQILSGADGTVVITPRWSRDPDSSVFFAAIGSEALNRAMALAKPDADGARRITIQANAAEAAKGYRIALPAAALRADSKSAFITLETPVASVTLASDMLDGDGASVAEFTIAAANRDGWNEAARNAVGNRPAVDISVRLDGKGVDWSNVASPVKATIPYTPAQGEAAEMLIVRYVDDSGRSMPVPNGRYENGEVLFRTTHLSTYAIAYGGQAFIDVPASHWAHRAVGALAAREIVKGRRDGVFDPAAPISRAEFVALLMRTLERETKGGGSGSGEAPLFKDVNAGAYYAAALRAAAADGIVTGDGDGRFRPNAQISRQELAAMVYRALLLTGRLAVPEGQAVGSAVFKDASDMAAYAREGIGALVSAGILQGSGQSFRPMASASRAEAAQVMYNVWLSNAE
ncbi:S-layer homology domain-containing protein [Cohnella sp. GbtcB17]|uniref:S-layer homology domain-containing protein n=1 Tax=Cohnella sp. GbtcB17 TaxID=2824762 RepID=UPI001C30EDD1|nr:S-layer homology domain-containing protein [Cohnella sp. GbtcB17]